jgi:hypothetical protein
MRAQPLNVPDHIVQKLVGIATNVFIGIGNVCSPIDFVNESISNVRCYISKSTNIYTHIRK